MKPLVVYYSRTGTTREAALGIAENLNAEIEEIKDKKSRKGIRGWLSAGKDAATKNPADITEIKKNPKEYDLVVIGTPVWAGTMAPAIRTYLNQHKIKKAAFFCTSGSGKEAVTFSDMLEIALGSKLVAQLSLSAKDVKSKKIGEKLNRFIAQIRSCR
ncbi:hypothetical protein GF323_03030 [Candidatus Woesearchaeota archaeon]|nr:hypothetical protein [Candidatus Woesearchaeota archaeon]